LTRCVKKLEREEAILDVHCYRRGAQSNENLKHTKWECKYHVVFIPKYRRKVMYGSIRQELGPIDGPPILAANLGGANLVFIAGNVNTFP
jgi:hypothetical protein